MMKKCLIAALALLTVFAIIGCNTPTSGTGGNQVPDNWTEEEGGEKEVEQEGEKEGLKPWHPETNPEEPAGAYRNYYDIGTDPEDWKYSTFAGTGNVGVIEANGDDTYKVTIPTVPGGVSIISFNSDDYMFKRGYYMLLDFPEDTEHKPIAAITLAATGSANDAGQDWGTAYNVNTESGYVPTLDDVYLAGEIAFARGDLDKLYKSVFITLVWHKDETAGYYEFDLKKLLITTDEDLTPPDPDTLEPWAPEADAKPDAGLTAFPDADILAMTSTWDGTSNSITSNGDGTYTVKVKARSGGDTRVYFTTTDDFESVFLSLTLPENASLKPDRIILGAAEDVAETGLWGNAKDVSVPDGKYLAGNVDILIEAGTKTFKTVVLYLYIPLLQDDDFYEFTLNDLSVAF